MKQSLLLFYILSFFITSVSNASTIKGFLTDSKTGEPLIGATITLKNTSFATSSGLDGSYEIKNVPDGNYIISISYIGYKNIESSISVNQQVSKLNFSLLENTKNLDEVVVTAASNDKESDNVMRKAEQKADNVMNIIGARAIELLPDVTVGNVLQRVSGVSVVRNGNGDGQYAIIRGMDQRYNYTLINGIKIPSPNDKNRYVPMDIFPADLIEKLEVVKALTPNMEGDAIGGAMNLVMKSAPNHFTISTTASGGFSSILGQQHFSGFSHKNIDFKSPGEVHGNGYNIPVTDFKVDQLKFKDVKNPINSLFNFTIGDKIFNNKLGYIIASTFQHTFRGSHVTYIEPNEQPNAGNSPAFNYVHQRTNSYLQSRLGLHAKFEYSLSKKNKISLYNFFSQLDENYHRYTDKTTIGYTLGDGYKYDRSRFQRQRIYNGTLKIEQVISNTLKFDISAAYSVSTNLIPDWIDFERKYTNIQDSTHGKQIYSTMFSAASITHRWTHNKDEDKSIYTNFVFNPSNKLEFSFGGLYRSKHRNRFYNSFNLTGTDKDGKLIYYNSIDINVSNAIFNWPTSNQRPDSTNANNYYSDEKITAGYVQGKVLVGNKLQILGGVRFENTNQYYFSQLIITADGKEGTIQYLDILPSVHFKFMINDKQNLRLSYYKAISRPSFFDLIPAEISGDYNTEKGNPYLSHTQSDNLDLRYEFFPKGNEQILAGVFYKSITNPIEYAFVSSGVSSQVYQPQNFGNATNYGFEFVVSKYYKNIGLTGNYTFTQSSITTTKRYLDLNNTAPIVSQTRPLQGQSAHIANISLIYKNSKFNVDAQLSWVYTGRRINYVSAWKDLDWWQRATNQLDFSGEKRFGKYFTVFGKVTNLLNNPVIVEILHSNKGFSGLPEQTKDDRILVQKDVFNQTYLLGIKYKFF